MQNRAFLFLFLSLILGAGAVFTAQRYLEDQRGEAPDRAKVNTQPVAVLRQDMSVGSVLHERELVTVEWPIEFVPTGAYSAPAQLEGRVLRRPLSAGEPVLEPSLLPEGSLGGLVSVINPELRAMSVQVDPVVGVAGFVAPGTHVDVLATLERDDRSHWSKVILQDVQVLAIDQKLEEVKEGEPNLVQVVTLEVSPVQAEKLTYASHEGKLQLALRNPTDREVVETRSVSVDDVLARRRPASKPRVARSTTNVEVIKGGNLSVERF